MKNLLQNQFTYFRDIQQATSYKIKMNKEIKFFRDIKKITRENRRIFSEVNKVFVTCQIIFFILDIRNPMGTWPSFLTQKDKYKSKKILIILNKCDLIPFNIAENFTRIQFNWLPFFKR